MYLFLREPKEDVVLNGKTTFLYMHSAGQLTSIGVRFNVGPVGAHIECGAGALGMVNGGLSLAF
jgi:hypothetical protein